MKARRLIRWFVLLLFTWTLGHAFFPATFSAHFSTAAEAQEEAAEVDDLAEIFKILDGSADEGLAHLRTAWRDEYAPMVLELIVPVRNPPLAKQLIDLMSEKTGQSFGYDLDAWYRWIWNAEAREHPRYAEFKALLYRRIDPRFERYFAQEAEHPPTIRLDEIRWGGVVQDGIPPLREPAMLKAAEAGYLDDDDVVFGVRIGDDARAYPKRILAWHEMFVDTINDIPIAGAYCTLCGSVLLWQTGDSAEDAHAMGTSGFLYRSNKLMFDQATQSLWSTLRGVPVVGPLVGQGISLKLHPVVTSTWGAWRKRHPETLVLSLETGHRRDYSEGAAYREYFATDALMFGVPNVDVRLKNKDEVLALNLPEHPQEPVALSSAFLAKNPLHVERVGDVDLIVLTDKSGAHRVYRSEGRTFKKWDRKERVTDMDGEKWTLQEDALVATDGRRLPRVPAHRAFWFGWHAAFPETRLVK